MRKVLKMERLGEISIYDMEEIQIPFGFDFGGDEDED